MISLRPYQQAAVDSVFDYFRSNTGNPLIVCPTGAGKSVIIAELLKRVFEYPNQRVAMLTHRKEIIEQNVAKLLQVWPQAPVEIYSASIGRRRISDITFASIQTVYRKAKDFGPLNMVFVDECHLLPKKGEGVYRTFIKEALDINPKLKVLGFTATPYRLDSGYLHRGDHRIFTDIAYDIPIRDLIEQGFLSPLISKNGINQADLSGVHIRGGEFVPGEAEAAIDKDDLTKRALDEIFTLGADRSSILIFCAGVDHAKHVTNAIDLRCVSCECVTGSTPKRDRERILEQFKRKQIRCLVNCDVLTTGFDAPNIDCLVLLRPTQSVSLYVQMVGRGSRIAPGKTDCLILDFAGNINRHGPLDGITVKEKNGKAVSEAPMTRTCPNCQGVVALQSRVCALCGYEFPRNPKEHDAEASTDPILSQRNSVTTLEIRKTGYKLHKKQGSPNSLRVDYYADALGILPPVCSEWLCLEHEGFAKAKAMRQWRTLSDFPRYDPPETIEEALSRAGELKKVIGLSFKYDGKYKRIVSYSFETEEIKKQNEELAEVFAGIF